MIFMKSKLKVNINAIKKSFIRLVKGNCLLIIKIDFFFQSYLYKQFFLELMLNCHCFFYATKKPVN